MINSRTTLLTALAGVAVLLFSPLARADLIPASWEESLYFDPMVSIPPAFTYYHDLTGDGFQPLEDLIVDYDLSIDLVDDGDRRGEWAVVDLPGVIGDEWFFDLSGDEFGGWSIAGVGQLNALGVLAITIDSYWGDFYLAGSDLVAYGLTTKVAEPGTLGLLGLALVGLGLRRRKRAD